MTTALVLAGGGAKGSFQVGVLHYLYRNDFCADIICSTSVGSVSAVQLAAGGTPAKQATAFDKLKTIWETELAFNQDMYVEAPWLAGVSPEARTLIGQLYSDNINVPPELIGTAVFFWPAALGQAIDLGVKLKDTLEQFKKAQSFFTLEPVREKINRHLDRAAVAGSGVELRLVAVSLDTGAVRYITQDGNVLETDGRRVPGYKIGLADGVIASSAIPCIFPPVGIFGEMYVDGGIRWQLPLQAALDFDPDLIVGVNTSLVGVQPAGSTFRWASMFDIAERVVLGIELWETQESHWRAARLEVVERKQKLWMITPRVEVHDTLLIDPGLIDINIAYGYMCAADVLTEFPFPRELSEFRPTPVASTGGRLGTRPSDPLIPAAAPARDKSLWVDTATDPVKAALADSIALCRRRCWELEHDIFGFRVPDGPFAAKITKADATHPELLGQLRDLKTLLGIMVLARQHIKGPLPPGASSWADGWERHRWAPADVPGAGATPWDEWSSWSVEISIDHLDSPIDVLTAPAVAAATRQTVMVASPPQNITWAFYEAWLLDEMGRRRIPSGSLAAFGGPSVVKIIPKKLLYSLPQGEDLP